MRDPCPHCGLRGIALSRVDNYTGQIVRDIKDHACPAWVTPQPLSIEPTDTTFIREAFTTAEAYEWYIKQMYNRPRVDLVGTGSYVTEREEYEARHDELTAKGIPHDYIRVQP